MPERHFMPFQYNEQETRVMMSTKKQSVDMAAGSKISTARCRGRTAADPTSVFHNAASDIASSAQTTLNPTQSYRQEQSCCRRTMSKATGAKAICRVDGSYRRQRQSASATIACAPALSRSFLAIKTRIASVKRHASNRVKPYLLFPWAAELVRHPRLLDLVEAVIGPDILVFHTTVWMKAAHSENTRTRPISGWRRSSTSPPGWH